MTKKRIEILDYIIRQNGIEFGNHIIIGLWDATYNINSTRNAKYFVKTKQERNAVERNNVLQGHCIDEIFSAVRDAAQKSGYIKIIESHTSKAEYLQIPKE